MLVEKVHSGKKKTLTPSPPEEWTLFSHIFKKVKKQGHKVFQDVLGLILYFF